MTVQRDVSIRELRNHTKQVVDGLDIGETVYLTRNGTRIAMITPLVEKSWAEQVAEIIGDGPPVDAGIADALEELDRRAADVENDDHRIDHADVG